MNASRHRATRSPGLRVPLGLVLAFTLMTWALGTPAPVGAARYELDHPSIRLQVILNSVHVYDDRDTFGEGDIKMLASLLRCPAATEACLPRENTVTLTEHQYSFDADSGYTRTLDRILPTAADQTRELYELTEDAGYPLYDDERYILRVEMWDRDPNNDDYLGWVDIPLAKENQWYLGTHQKDSTRNDSGARGDFRLDYDVVVTQLPNLTAFKMERHDAPDKASDLVCASVHNSGPGPSGRFDVVFRFYKGWPANATIDSGGGLAPNQITTICTVVELPTTSTPGDDLWWSVYVDQAGDVPEMNEHDNLFTEPYAARPRTTSAQAETGDAGATPPPVASPAPSPVPSAPGSRSGSDQANLTVSSFRVNGQTPDGKDDCKDGKSSVTVLVKNAGSANTGASPCDSTWTAPRRARSPWTASRPARSARSASMTSG